MEQYFDLTDALNRVRGNKQLLKKMLGLFLQSEDFEGLRIALMQKNYPEAAQKAHALKGVSGNLSLPALFAVSSELLHELREGRSSSDLLQRYQEVLLATQDQIEQVLATW